MAEALNDVTKPHEIRYDYQTLRDVASAGVTEDNFALILESYKAAQEEGDFDGWWDPEQIETVDQLRNEIRQSGHHFWGDHIILQLLHMQLQINVVFLNSEESLEQEEKLMLDLDNPIEVSLADLIQSKKIIYKIHPTCMDLNPEYQTIILYYHEETHFQLVGYFQKGLMRTVFDYDKLPPNLLKVYQEDCNVPGIKSEAGIMTAAHK